MPIKGVLLFVVLICSLPVCFFSPFYGILLWQVIAFLNPQSALLYWSVALDFPWALAIAIPTLAGLFLFGGNWMRRLAVREIYLIVALWIWFTVTSIVSSSNGLFLHHADLTWFQWRFVSKILLMTLAVVAIVNSFDRLRIMIITICGCFAFFVIKDIPFIILTGGQYRIYGPDRSMIADNNDFGLAMNMTLPLFFLLARTEPSRRMRWFWGALFILGVPIVLFTYSRGAVVGLAAILVLMILQLRQRLILVPIVALGVVLALAFAPESWKHRMDPTSRDVLDTSAQERLNSWAFSENLAADYPITGGGFQTFTPELFARYAPQGNDIHGPHSVYFQLLAEHGYTGLILYLSLVISCLFTLKKTGKIARRLGDTTIAEYTKMLRFSLIAFLVSGTFLGRAYFDYFFSVVGCIVILYLVARQRSQQDLDEIEEASEALVGEELPALSGS